MCSAGHQKASAPYATGLWAAVLGCRAFKRQPPHERTFYSAPCPSIESESLQESRMFLISPLLALLGYCIGLTCLQKSQRSLASREWGRIEQHVHRARAHAEYRRKPDHTFDFLFEPEELGRSIVPALPVGPLARPAITAASLSSWESALAMCECSGSCLRADAHEYHHPNCHAADP